MCFDYIIRNSVIFLPKFLSIENTLRVTESMEIVLKWGVVGGKQMILTNPFSSVCKYHILFIFEVSSRTLTIGEKEEKRKGTKRDEKDKSSPFFQSISALLWGESLGRRKVEL